jgi:hypothetical protein
MKARLVPLYFGAADDTDFVEHVRILRHLLGEHADLLEPVPLGATVPEADAVVFPQLVGEAYRRVHQLRALELPSLVLTSDFATMAMWDWEIISYLKSEGLSVIAPYSLDDATVACRALAAKRQLREGKFLVYQDRPGEGGAQPSIFKRFYWWEDECSERIRQRFGLRLVKKSFQELGKRARELPDTEAQEDWDRFGPAVPLPGVSHRGALSAFKLYRAVRDDLDEEGDVLAAGINCLNESSFSDTTPCLAWDLLYTERDLIWGCEADTVSMLTEFIVNRSLGAPIVMTNLYPFLMGQAALQHERIPAFPDAQDPEDHVLAAHCGYLGVLPRPMATDWALRRKVLAIVDENATAIDARLPVGELTLAKLGPTFDTLYLAEGELTGYAGYPGSDCLNGAIVRVPDGHALMRSLPSHHSIMVAGHHRSGFEVVGQVFGLEIERITGGRDGTPRGRQRPGAGEERHEHVREG